MADHTPTPTVNIYPIIHFKLSGDVTDELADQMMRTVFDVLAERYPGKVVSAMAQRWEMPFDRETIQAALNAGLTRAVKAMSDAP